MKLDGKVAIITGAAGGLGRAIALCMAEEGANIIVADINMEAADRVAQEVKNFGRKALVIDADVTKEENAKKLVDSTINAFGKIDILVNNVGAGHAEAGVFDENLSEKDWNRMYTAGITELHERDWDRSYIANFKPGIFMCKAVIPHMRAQKSGKIINISSTAGRRGGMGRLPYSTMKGAVIIFTQGIAMQVARDNINVNCICPGIIYTSIHEDMAKIRMRTNPRLKDVKDPREAFELILGGIPMRREQTPEDVGRAAVFLASEDARNITGQSINVDGGSHMS